MPPKRRRVAPLLLAAAMLMPAASAVLAGDDVPVMLQSMPGMQLIAAVDAMHAGDLTKAEALFTLAIQQGKLAPEGMAHALFNRALVRQRMGNLQLAIADFSKALASDVLSTTGRVEAYYNRGLAWRKLGELQKAMDDFSRAIELQPRFAPPYYSRALGLTANGHYLLALVDLDKALKYGFEQKHKVHYSKAMIHLARGEETLAIRELRLALKYNANFRPARLRLAALQGRSRQQATAALLPAAAQGGQLHARLASLSRHDGRQALASVKKPAKQKVARPTPTSTQKRMVSGAVRAAGRPTGAMTKPRNRPARRLALMTQSRQAVAAAATEARVRRQPRPAANAEATGMMVPSAFAAPPSRLSRLITGSIAPATHPRTSATKSQERIRPEQPARHGAWGVQLAASRSERDMAMRWRILRPKVARLLPAPKVRIMRAQLKERGTYYRLRLVGFASRGNAVKACDKLRGNGISCIVVRVR